MTFLAIDNPIMHAELAHQRRIIRTSRSGWFWIVLALLMLVPALVTTLVIIPAALLGVDLDSIFTPPPWNLLANIGVTSLMIMHFALYIVVTLVTLALAARSITREHDSRTWESLLLTDMTARQIVQGKWWATLRALWGDHVMVLVLRLGFVALLGFLTRGPLPPRPAQLLLALGFVTLLTLIDSALSVIVGILPPVGGRSPVVLMLAMGLRLFAATGVLGLTIAAWLQFADWSNGILAGGVLLLGLFAILTFSMLRLTEWAAVRNLASPTARA